MGTGGVMSSVTVVGLGNIGSHAAVLLARTPEVTRLILVDRDSYEPLNLEAQDILPCDVGRPKAQVQARRLRRIRPALRVEALEGAVENLPLGRLRAEALLSCVDSRRARQSINEISWRLGIPWIDAGVHGQQLLARVNVYLPGEERPCVECAWAASDYESLEQVYPCDGPVGRGPARTGSPAALGALAAALQALECRKVLRRECDRAAVGRQLTFDTQWHKQYVASLARNPDCRFDHRTWRVEKLECRLDRFSVRQALRLGGCVELERKPFARRLVCRQCGASRRLLWLACALDGAAGRCADCGAAMTAAGFDLIERLSDALPPSDLDLALSDVGLRGGDIFRAGSGAYYEIACDHR